MRMSDSEISTWKVSDQKVEPQTVEGGGGCGKGPHDKSSFEILALPFEL